MTLLLNKKSLTHFWACGFPVMKNISWGLPLLKDFRREPFPPSESFLRFFFLGGGRSQLPPLGTKPDWGGCKYFTLNILMRTPHLPLVPTNLDNCCKTLSLFLSLSLSHTHTHTQRNTHTHTLSLSFYLCICMLVSLSFSLSLSLSLSHGHFFAYIFIFVSFILILSLLSILNFYMYFSVFVIL